VLEILQFIFQDFWHWAGTLLLVGVIAEGIGGFVRIRITRSGK
jgi:fido (protein-threonine AMPylation protein)